MVSSKSPLALGSDAEVEVEKAPGRNQPTKGALKTAPKSGKVLPIILFIYLD